MGHGPTPPTNPAFAAAVADRHALPKAFAPPFARFPKISDRGLATLYRCASNGDYVTPLIGVFDMFSASVAARHYDLVDIDDGYVDPEVACHVVELADCLSLLKRNLSRHHD